MRSEKAVLSRSSGPVDIGRRCADLLASRIRQAHRRASRAGDMLAWFKHYTPHHFDKPFSALHRHMGLRFEVMRKSRGQKEGVIAPRGNAKTTCASLGLPLHAICEGYERYILLAADSMGQAIQRVEAVAHELTTNVKIERDYPHVFGQGVTWNKHEIVTRNGVKVQALGTRKKIRGIKFHEQRPTLIIADDLDDDDTPFSALKRERNWSWVTRNLLNLGSPQTNYWFNGSALHPECIICRLPKAGVKIHTFKSIIEWPERMDLWSGWSDMLHDLSVDDLDEREERARGFYESNRDDMEAAAVVLWPEWEDLYDLMTLREHTGHRAFAGEKQGEALDPSLSEWDPRHFEGDVWFDKWPRRMQVKTMALDPSLGKHSRRGDYQAITKLGIKGSNIHLDAIIGRWPVVEMLERFVDEIVEFRPDVAVIEADAFQELLLYMADNIALRRKLTTNIEPISHEGVNKRVRLGRLGPFVVRDQVRYMRRSPGIAILHDQMRAFPDPTVHDDGPDSWEMALRKARRMMGAAQRPPRRNPY